MDIRQVKKIYDRLLPTLNRQRRECKRVDSWLKPLERGFELPAKATREHQGLADLSRTPWLRLVVDNVTQAMYVDSIVGEDGRIDELWRLWHDNACDAQQIPNHRSFVAYGHSYGVVTPGVRAGQATAKIRFVSPKSVAVEFEDAGADLYPSAALESVSSQDDTLRYRLFVPGRVLTLVQGHRNGSTLDGLSVESEYATGLDVVPVVQFSNQKDLDGNVIGEVEPFIPTAQRINKTAYDRLLAQHYNSWKVKYVTGLELPTVADEYGNPTGEVDQAEAEKLKLKLAQDDILVAEEPDSKFGTLDATALEPFVTSWRSDIEALAAVSQTPAHALTGQLVNLNAEALAAARAPLTQKVFEREKNAGASYARVLRLAAFFAGYDDIAGNELVRVTWQDMEIRSLSQAVDALGKASQMLGVPARGLWSHIPGIEASDVQEWERLADEDNERDPLNGLMRRHTASTVETVSGGDE